MSIVQWTEGSGALKKLEPKRESKQWAAGSRENAREASRAEPKKESNGY